MPSDSAGRHEEYRRKLLGLGESSLRKNYYPELRKRMRELEESRKRYQTIFNATADAMFIHDINTCEMIDYNQRVCQMLGYDREELNNLGFEQLCGNEAPYDFARASEYIRSAVRDGTLNFEWRVQNKAGKYLWCDISLTKAMINDDPCVIASVRDISKRKLLEEQLMQSQKMDAMGQLAGGVAHDFNNILMGIMSAAEVVRILTKDNQEISEMIQVILKAADTAANFTKQLLSFSRKESIELSEMQLHEAIRNATEILARSLPQKVVLNVKLNAISDLVMGNFSQLENVIINMSINARDSMPEGGELTISTSNRSANELGNAKAGLLRTDKYICITIADTGSGISEEVMQHIFEPFYTTKEAGKGTGLGLAAVYGAVQKHNGVIEVESELGRGTVFSIDLPLLEKTVAPVGFAAQEDISLMKLHIMLVDDDEGLRFIGEKMLQNLGYEVSTAVDGESAVESFIENRPDLVLLDMNMPNMSGKECFTELRRIDSSVPVIAVSGDAMTYELEELSAAGLAGVMQKPYRTEALKLKLLEVLGAGRE